MFFGEFGIAKEIHDTLAPAKAIDLVERGHCLDFRLGGVLESFDFRILLAFATFAIRVVNNPRPGIVVISVYWHTAALLIVVAVADVAMASVVESPHLLAIGRNVATFLVGEGKAAQTYDDGDSD